MNHPQILINGKQAKLGTVFNDNAVVTWAKDNQAMKVLDMNSKNKKQYIMLARPEDKKSLTAWEILTRVNHLSTHAPSDSMSVFKKMEAIIAPKYYLLDSIKIPTDTISTGTCYFRGWYMYGETRIIQRLNCIDGQVVIDKSLFLVDNKWLDPRDILLSIDYYNKDIPLKSVSIKDNIKLIMVPEVLN